MLELTPEAIAAFTAHTWPGNVRELRNTLERAAILCPGDSVGAEFFPFARPGIAAVKIGDPVSIDTIEEQHIKRVLENATSLESAAEVLGIDQATLWRRRKKYGI